MSRALPDESAQVSDIREEAMAIALRAAPENYDLHAIAEGLLHAARDILADDDEFLRVFSRFSKLRGWGQ